VDKINQNQQDYLDLGVDYLDLVHPDLVEKRLEITKVMEINRIIWQVVMEIIQMINTEHKSLIITAILLIKILI